MRHKVADLDTKSVN